MSSSEPDFQQQWTLLCDFVKVVLLKHELVRGDVADLNCSLGSRHFGELERSGATSYVGIGALERLEACEKKWHQRLERLRGAMPLLAVEFVRWDQSSISLSSLTLTSSMASASSSSSASGSAQLLDTWKKKKAVLMFRGIGQACGSSTHMNALLEWIGEQLDDGGVFVGLMLDSSAVWTMLNKPAAGSDAPFRRTIRDAHGIWSVDVLSSDIHRFGTRIAVGWPSSARKRVEQTYLVHFSSMIRAARRHHLHLIDMVNVREFYEDHRKHYRELLALLSLPEKINDPKRPWPLASLMDIYCIPMFEKRST
jgi:hypothetical protein